MSQNIVETINALKMNEQFLENTLKNMAVEEVNWLLYFVWEHIGRRLIKSQFKIETF